MNTRAVHQHSRLSTLLAAQGAIPVEYPCIAIAPPADPTPLCAALAQLATYDWLILTSANAVAAISPCPLFPASLVPRAEEGYKAEPSSRDEGATRGEMAIAAIGPSTAKAVRECLGVEPTLLPETFTAEALAEVLPIQPGERVLIPASALTRPTLAERLRERGAEVTVVDAYQTVLGEGGDDLPQLLRTRTVDAITFTSASTVTNFLTRLEREGGNRADLEGVCLVSIGPQTTAEAQRLGLNLTREAHVHTLDGLIAILREYFA